MDDINTFFADYIAKLIDKLIDADGEITRDGRTVEISRIRVGEGGSLNIEFSEFHRDGKPTTDRPRNLIVTVKAV